MAPTNCEISIILTCSAKCFIVVGAIDGQEPKFKKKTDMKLYALVVTLSTQDYARLLEK